MIVIVQRFFGQSPQNDRVAVSGHKTGGRGRPPLRDMYKIKCVGYDAYIVRFFNMHKAERCHPERSEGSLML